MADEADQGPPKDQIVFCDTCGIAMDKAASIPAFGPHPALQSYRCSTCGASVTVEIPDPK